MRKLLIIFITAIALVGGGCFAGEKNQQPQSGKTNQTENSKTGGSEAKGINRNKPVNTGSGNDGKDNNTGSNTGKDNRNSNTGGGGTKGTGPKDDAAKDNAGENEAAAVGVQVKETPFDSGAYPRIYGDVFWSPGGKRFAYVADEPGGKLGIYLAQAGESGKGLKIKEFAYDTKFGSPFVSLGWSPDADIVYYLFSSYVGPEYKPIFKFGKIDLNTRKEKTFRMKDISILSGTVNWAPRAGLVSFWGDGGIQKMELASGKMTRLVRVESRDSLFTVAASPDGTKLAYTRMFGYRSVSQEKVFVLDVVTGKETLVSPDGKYSWYPKWFSDGEKVGFLTTSYKGKDFEVVQGEAGPLLYSEGITIVRANGEPVRNLEFKGEHIIGFSPLAGRRDQVEVYTGRKVQVAEQGGISFILDTHRIMELTKGKIVWEKKFPKVQSGENNSVLWVDENTWVNIVSTPNSVAKTLTLKNVNDKELAKVNGVVENIFITDKGLIFARQGETGQDLWFLSKAGQLNQLTKTDTVKKLSGINDGKVVYLEDSGDGNTQRLRMLRLELLSNTNEGK